jgi:uncharacterized protein (TIGR00369 family)
MTPSSAVPPGFEKLVSTSPFHELVGPLYEKRDDNSHRIGFVVAEKHKNRRGIVHGGMICTLADFAMGHAASLATGTLRKLVTVNLSIDFAGNATVGDWIEAHVDVMRPGNRVAFVNCFIFHGGERIARSSATFQILRADE